MKKNNNDNAMRNNSFGGDVPAVKGKARKKKTGGLSVGKKVAISIILVIYALIIATTSFIVFYKPTKDSRVYTKIEKYIDENGVEQTREIEIEAKPIEGSYNFLLLGHDRAAMLTDVFMIVNLNANSHTITIMQIPRDTWISDHEGYNFYTNKINEVFSSHYNRHRGEGIEDEKAYKMALTELTDTLEGALGIGIHASAILDLNGFSAIVDEIGGVEIDVQREMYYNDPAQGLYINLSPGLQTLNGSQAEGFVRFRYGYATADLGRQNAQKMFVAAFFNKLKSSLGVDKVISISDIILDNIVTDFNVADAPFFIQAFLDCDLDNMNMLTMPGNLANSFYVMNRAAVQDIIETNYKDYDVEELVVDPEGLFNNPSIDSMNACYNLPADQMFDNNVYNGQEIEDDPIDIY